MSRGDHLQVCRLAGLYNHHGIDLGDGTVVHLSGEPLRARRARVERSSLAAFCQGAEAQVVVYGTDCDDPEVVVERALSRLGEPGYQLWSNNCEHFATYCKTGRPVSRQARRAGLAAATVAGLALVGGVVWAAARGLRGRGRSGPASV